MFFRLLLLFNFFLPSLALFSGPLLGCVLPRELSALAARCPCRHRRSYKMQHKCDDKKEDEKDAGVESPSGTGDETAESFSSPASTNQISGNPNAQQLAKFSALPPSNCLPSLSASTPKRLPTGSFESSILPSKCPHSSRTSLHV